MATDTKPNLSDRKFEQLSGETLHLSGSTYIHDYGTFQLESGATLSILTDAGIGKILTSDANGVATWQVYSPTGASAAIAFQVKDISGGTEANNAVGNAIEWTTTEFTSSSVVYTGGSKIWIAETGTYSIGYGLNAESVDNSAPKNIGTVITKNGNVDITPSTSTSFSMDSKNNRGSNTSAEYQALLTAGDYIELYVFRVGKNQGSVLTKAKGQWLSLSKRT